MNSDNKRVVLSDGEISVSVEQESSIHLKAVSPFGDPVELNAEEAKELAALLLKFAEEID